MLVQCDVLPLMQVLECVTANLTLVYAILAYSSLKKNYAQSAHVRLDRVIQ